MTSSDWMKYVEASYDLVKEAEAKINLTVDVQAEAFVVHTFAKYMAKPEIPTDAIAIKMLSAMGESGKTRRDQLQEIAEECLLIDGLRLNCRRWPSHNYYTEMGQMALGYRAWSQRPPELIYDRFAYLFPKLTLIVGQLRSTMNTLP